MRLASFTVNRQLRHGRIEGERIVDLGPGDIGDVFVQQANPRFDAAGNTHYALDEVTLRAPILRPGKLLAVAANYQEHVREGGGDAVDKQRTVPRLFLKPPTTILGPDEPLMLPRVSQTVDWELELGVLIGKRAKDITVDDALGVVAGYTVINDISARTLSVSEADRDLTGWPGFFDWLMGKWLDGFCPMGPVVVTADEVPDPQAMKMSLSVNGVTRQDGTTGDMIFSVAELVSFASRLMTLEPGDVIATGTPAGVGAASGTYLAPGDVMEAEVEGIGRLCTKVVAPE